MLVSLLFIACAEHKEKASGESRAERLEVPEIVMEKSELKYKHEISLWTLNDQPYSGFAATYYPAGSLKEKFGILNGKKQNEAIQWFRDGHLKDVTNYHLGKMHGEKRIWSSDSAHILIAQFNFDTGKAHGEQIKWYPSGELFKKLNLNRGKEEGIQQAYRKNGALYANYEAKEGRIFGMKKAALCYGLEDENLKYNE